MLFVLLLAVLHLIYEQVCSEVRQAYRFGAPVLLVAVDADDRGTPQVGIVGPRRVLRGRRRPVEPRLQKGILSGRIGVQMRVRSPPDLGDSARGDLGDWVRKDPGVVHALVLVLVNVARVEEDTVDGVVYHHFPNVLEVGRPVALHNVASDDNDLEGSLGVDQLVRQPLGLFLSESVAPGGIPVPVVVRNDEVDIAPVIRKVHPVVLVGVASIPRIGPQALPGSQGIGLALLVAIGVVGSVFVVVPRCVRRRAAQKLGKVRLPPLLQVAEPNPVELDPVLARHVNALLQIDRVARQHGKMGVFSNAARLRVVPGDLRPHRLTFVLPVVHARGQNVVEFGRLKGHRRCPEGSLADSMAVDVHAVLVEGVGLQSGNGFPDGAIEQGTRTDHIDGPEESVRL
mmetsp:Transcript_13807/g.32226  ORF Transcript_13807/g.32226 Transcript_13807/m.32226 type:complete len:399 (+) Transcript_13807:342-1538(+)